MTNFSASMTSISEKKTEHDSFVGHSMGQKDEYHKVGSIAAHN